MSRARRLPMLIGAVALSSLLGDKAAAAGSAPYLVAFGAVAPRFAAPPPPTVTESTTEADGGQTDPEIADPTGAAEPAASTAAPEPPSRAADPQTPATVDPVVAPAPPRIIPDDIRPRVRAEDILPYFRYPSTAASQSDADSGSHGLPTLPAPGTLPASSATYRLQ